MITIEDYIETLTGLQETDVDCNFSIIRSDYSLVTSLAKQTVKGIGLTDRQYELTKLKLLDYKEQFESNGFHNIDDNFNNLRIPIRSIDRSRWIKIVEDSDRKYIGVRFTFNKKLISALETMSSIEVKTMYDSENKVHFYELTEINVYKIISVLADKNFVIESKLQEIFNILQDINNNKDEYIPGIYNFKLKNLHQRAIDYIVSDIGLPNKQNLSILKDRHRLYGLTHFDNSALEESLNNVTALSKKIVKRNTSTVFISNNTWSFDQVIESIIELDRFPIVILIDEQTPYDDLISSYGHIKNIVDSKDVSVQFRMPSNLSNGFNEFIKLNNLNNVVDKNTKVVYTSKDKINKPLIKSSCKPICVLSTSSSRANRRMEPWLESFDLVIQYDNTVSQFMRYGKTGIEEL